MENTINKTRLYFFDNIKCLLMILVVIGHTITSDVDDNSYLKSMLIFIYSFHMPLFIFISGLFHNNKENTLNWNKFIKFFCLGLILKMGIMSFDTLLIKNKLNFNLLGGDGLFWYLFAMATYIVICYLLRNFNSSFVLYVSVLLSLLVGYDESIGDFLCLSRIIVFFPFYYVGYCLTPEKVLNFFNRYKKIITLISIVLILLLLYMSIAQLDLIYPLRALFTGRNCYEKVYITNCSMIHRLLTTIISAVFCMAFLGIMPRNKIPFISNIGTKTLQIYFWHGFILRILRKFNVFVYFERVYPNYCWIIFSCIGLLITMLLSLDFFNVPIKYIMSCMNNPKKQE